MGIGNIGLPEILVILLIVLLFFGAKRIPEIAGSFGKGIKEFKRSLNDVERSIREPEPSEPALRRPDDRLEYGTRSHAEDRVRPSDSDTLSRRDDETRSEPKRLLS
jgi:sec-independent protein translocase protein TatA